MVERKINPEHKNHQLWTLIKTISTKTKHTLLKQSKTKKFINETLIGKEKITNFRLKTTPINSRAQKRPLTLKLDEKTPGENSHIKTWPSKTPIINHPDEVSPRVDQEVGFQMQTSYRAQSSWVSK